MPTGGCQKPYHDTSRRQRRRAARGGQRQGRRRRREDGRVHHPSGERQEGLRRRRQHRGQPRVLQLGDPRRHGLPHGGGDPELLDLRQGLRPRRPHVRAGGVVVLARPPLPGLGLVGQVLEPGAVELHQRHRRPLHPDPDAEVRRPGHRHRHGRHHQRLDRHHLAPLQQARLVGLLRPDRRPARLRRRLGRGLPAGGPELPHSRHLEPAARLRGRAEGPPAPQHPAAEQLLRRGQEGDPALGHVGHALARPTASTRRPASTRARPTSPRSSTPP